MGSTTLFENQGVFDDGTRYEMVATDVPASGEYPDGVKYRFQYLDENGRTLLRLDNFPAHPDVDRHPLPHARTRRRRRRVHWPA